MDLKEYYRRKIALILICVMFMVSLLSNDMLYAASASDGPDAASGSAISVTSGSAIDATTGSAIEVTTGPAVVVTPPAIVLKEQEALYFSDTVPDQVDYGTESVDLSVEGGSGTGEVSYHILSGEENAVIENGNQLIIKNAGNVEVEAVKAEDEEYLEASVSKNIEIVKKEVTIQINTSKYRGQQNPDFEEIMVQMIQSSLIDGDSINRVPGGDYLIVYQWGCEQITLPEILCTAKKFSKGTYPVKFSKDRVECGNYSFTFVEGELRIDEFTDKKYVILPDKEGSRLYNQDVTILPDNGYKVLESDSTGGVWESSEDAVDKLIYTEEGEYKVYFHLYNESMNSTSVLFSEEFVIDKTLPDIDYEFDKEQAPVKENYYNAYRTLNISLEDEHFSDELISITVEKDGELTAIPDSEWNTTSKEEKSWAFSIVLEDGEYENLKIVCTDKADNVSETVIGEKFIIDTTPPSMDICFTNNNPVNGNYYNTSRLALVFVNEKNFDPEDMYIEIIKDGEPGTVSGSAITWKKIGNSYGSEILFSKDGKYTLNMKYIDPAGNPANDVSSEEFIIDRTLPEIIVSYDNNDVKNNRFYQNNRTATISIKEKNFNPSDIQISLKKKVGIGIAEEVDLSHLTWEGEDDTYVETIVYDEDAEYIFHISYTDLAGNRNDTLEDDSFVVDKEAPVNLKVQYNNDPVKEFLSGITGGLFFNQSTKVTVFAEDITAGVDQIHYSYIRENGEIQNGILNETEEEAGVYSSSFQIEPEFKGHIEVTIFDRAGNFVSATDEEIVIDSIPPEIHVSYDKRIASGYYNESRTATIQITENNFDVEDVVISVTKGEKEVPELIPSKESWKKVEGKENVYQTTICFDNDGKYQLKISYTDKSLNKGNSYESELFVIDKTRPELSVKYDNNNSAEGNYYNAKRTATITIKEENFSNSEVKVTITAKDIFGKEITVPDISSWDKQGDISTAHIEFAQDAIYTFDIDYTDLAGNKANEYPTDNFVVDTKAPVILSDDMIYKKKNSGSLAKFINYISFGYFCNETVQVSVKSTDETSGMKSIIYYTEDKEKGKSQETTLPLGKEGESVQTITFDIPPNFKGTVYAIGQDYAHNKSTEYTKAKSIIIKKADKNASDTITIKPLTEPNKNGFYNSDVEVALKILEPYSGINKFTYDVGATSPVTVNLEQKEDITYEWNKVVKLDALSNNNNKVGINITYNDNAGNENIIAEKDIKIDVTRPVLDVTYDNNDFLNSTYYCKERTATIQIEELNFNPEDVKITIYKDKELVQNLTPKTDNWKSKGIVHTAYIRFAEDGDYRFQVSYTDLADNEASYEHDDEFTIDLTKPVLQVTFDNNAVLNTSYYKESRQAKVVIQEHNFNPEDVNITMTGSYNGKGIPLPGVSSWNTEGDTHTATISFGNDGDYSLMLDYTDMAGNQIDPFEKQEFTIDTTAPELQITGVEDKHAYNGELKPVIEYTDTNFNTQQVSVSLKGYKKGEVSQKGHAIRMGNGEKIILDIFPILQDMDDFYTLSVKVEDNAGNETEAKLSFSVNRFGSVYSVDDKTEKIRNSYINQEVDLVLMETNVDSLKEYSINYSKDGIIQALHKGQDYKVEQFYESGGWNQYVYTIYSKNFAAEGNYIVMVASSDNAGNLSNNNIKKEEIQFTVDKTKPKATVMGIESGAIYNTETEKARIVVKDNLRLSDVKLSLNGKKVSGWKEESIHNEAGDFSIEIPESNNKQNLEVEFKDAAGNTGSLKVDEFLVTQNRWVQYYNNKKAIYASFGMGGIAIAMIARMLRRRKKIQ